MRHDHYIRLALEQFEQRVTPAKLVSPTQLNYLDVDGDKVAVVFSKPILTAANVGSVFKFNPIGFPNDNTTPQQLQTIDVTGAGLAQGVGITVTSTAAGGGDGFVNIGYVNSTNRALGAVTIDGDLGQVDAGDSTTLSQAITSLTVHSWGRFGIITQAPPSSLHSEIYGHIGAVVVKTDMFGWLDATGLHDGKIASITIGGSLIGGATDNLGSIGTNGPVGAIAIKGDIIGAAGNFSGEINAGNKGSVAKLTIGGSVIGGQGNSSGNIDLAGTIGQLRIAGSVIGGGGAESGEVLGERGIGSATIGGSVIGGAGQLSGVVRTFDALLGPVHVGGNILGGGGTNSGRVSSDGNFASINVRGSVIGNVGNFSGTILGKDMKSVTIGGDLRGGVGISSGGVVTRDLGLLTIGGSIVGGTGQDSGEVNPNHLSSGGVAGDVAGGGGANSGSFFTNSIGSLFVGGSVRSGTIASDDRIGSIKVGGSLVGNGRQVLIQAGGKDSLAGPTDVILGSLKVQGSVSFTKIVAGVTDTFAPVNADAQIGTVSVGGDWIASSLAAGVNPVNSLFGDGNDTLAVGGKNDAAVFSKIGSLTIGGQAEGTAAANGDAFAITAESIGSVKIGGVTLPTVAAAKDDFFVGISVDFKVREI